MSFLKTANFVSSAKFIFFPFIIILAMGCSLTSQNDYVNERTGAKLVTAGVETYTYKTVDAKPLTLNVRSPENMYEGQLRPAIVFYFGGGWNSGSIKQFEPQSKYFTEQGLITIVVNYRVKNRHGTTPAEAVSDAKSAMRWIKKNAQNLNINANKIIAAGGSAGGHLAAATAFISGFNDPQDDLSISTIPQALLLFNPVIDNGPGGYGYERVSEYWESFSPLHNINSQGPPTLTMLGTKDALIPVETGEAFNDALISQGGISKLRLYNGQKHGFFNKAKYKETLKESHNFLFELGYLPELYIEADKAE